MHFIVLTLFTEIYSSLNHSIIGKALEEKKLKIDVIDIRKYSKDKHKNVMIIFLEGIWHAYDASTFR